MKLLTVLANLIFLPFDLIGQLLALAWRGTAAFITKFLLSPWGLLVPSTLIAAIGLVYYLSQNSTDLAAGYVRELESCEEDRIPVLLEALVQLGKPGIPSLVAALRQKREAVFSATDRTIHSELERWERLDRPERLRRYRLLSQAFLDQARSLDEEGQNIALRLCRRMLRNLVLIKNSSESGDTADLRAVTRNCERLFSAIETRRKKNLSPNGPQNKASAETVAHHEGRSFDSALMASMGKPFGKVAGEETTAPNDLADVFATSRAERLYAYHESPQFRNQIETPYHRPGLTPPGHVLETPQGSTGNELNGGEMIASMSPVRQDDFTGKKYHPSVFPTLADSGIQGKVAERFAPPENSVFSDIARDYLGKNPVENKKGGKDRTDAVSGEIDSNVFLPRELREIALDRIPGLSAARLMRLLQHPDERYVSEARKTLVARDGFRDAHLKLAFRLFHPVPTVREEIIAMLPNTTGVQPRVWLSVLLEDPNSEVRYRAASFLATTEDPSLQRLLIDHGKRDTDSRIVDLADRLIEQQHRRVRR